MQAVRCTRCGETRWTLFRRVLEKLLATPCESCGGARAVERRRPGNAPRGGIVHERRSRVT